MVQPAHPTSEHGRYAALVAAAEKFLSVSKRKYNVDEYDAACAGRSLEAALEALVPRAMPTHTGRWYWAEWGRDFEVYKKRGGRHLYVTPPGGVEVRITPKIAGGWLAVPQDSEDSSVPDP